MKNILEEEISYMKKLFETKGGFLISEQTTSPIVADLYHSVAGPGTNPEKFRNAIIQIKNAQEFSLVNSELKKYKNSTLDIAGWINDDFDNTNIDDVKKISDHLKSISVNNSYDVHPSGGFKQGTFKILATTPAAPSDEDLKKREDTWKNTYSCVPTQKGATLAKLNDGTTAYKIGEVTYYNTGRKKLADGTMTNYSCTSEFKKIPNSGVNTNSAANRNKNVNVNNRFVKSASSLGIQNGKMDIQTLQTLINTLEGGQSTAAAT